MQTKAIRKTTPKEIRDVKTAKPGSVPVRMGGGIYHFPPRFA